LEDAGIGGCIKMSEITEEDKGVSCLHVAQVGAEWWAVVNTAMSLTALQNVGDFLRTH
jgi:hypothetical protein